MKEINENIIFLDFDDVLTDEYKLLKSNYYATNHDTSLVKDDLSNIIFNKNKVDLFVYVNYTHRKLEGYTLQTNNLIKS